jgi:hypothetical protein
LTLFFALVFLLFFLVFENIMNNAVMRAAMVRIGFTEMAAQALVDEQGMDSLGEIKLLTDDEIESLCKVIRHPGGMIPAPPGGAAGGAANIPNPGVPVNQRAYAIRRASVGR